MEKIDFKSLFLTGASNAISATSKEELLSRYGQPSEIETYEGVQYYYHYENVRFSLRGDNVVLVSIFFHESSSPQYTYSLTGEDMVISEKLPLHSFFYLLNEDGVPWEISREEIDKDYLVIIIRNSIRVYYYLYDGLLFRIDILTPDAAGVRNTDTF